MRKTLTRALLALAVGGCGSDSPPGANVGLDKTMPDSPLAQLPDVSLIRAGDAFTLAGYDAVTGTVHWGRLALDGTLTPETSFALAQPLVGPVFAATQKVSPGDQLVALAIVNSATVAGGYDLVARVHTAGAPGPAAPVVLSSSDSIPPGADPASMRMAAGASANGTVGYVAWGTRFKGKPIFYLTLPADAATSAEPSTFLNAPVPADVPEWDCLRAQAHPAGFSFSAVTQNATADQSDYHVLQVDESGAAPADMAFQLTVVVKNCQIVGVPAPTGIYLMAFQGIADGATAIDFATYYPQGSSVVTQKPVLSEARFGDPLNMPAPAWVSAAGNDIVIGLTRKAGPQVFRFRHDSVQRGSTLQLRSANGNTGPVAASVGQDAVYATYADYVKTAVGTMTQRYFMRIDSLAVLP